MRVVVTGATGNVGRGVVAALEADPNIEVIIGIARRASSREGTRARYVGADVSQDDLVPLFAHPDVVIHPAWHFQPTHSASSSAASATAPAHRRDRLRPTRSSSAREVASLVGGRHS